MNNVRETGTTMPMSEFLLAAREFGWILLGGLTLVLVLGFADFEPTFDVCLRPFRLLLGGFYIIYAPGYCLTAVFFPQKHDLDNIERIGMSIGLSIAWVPVLALIISWLPSELRLWPIVWGELGSIFVFSAIATWRRTGLPQSSIYIPTLPQQPKMVWANLSGIERKIYALCLGAFILLLAAMLWTVMVTSPNEFVTEFYMLGEHGLAENFVQETAVSTATTVTIGIANRERTPQIYRVEVWAVDLWSDTRTQVQVVPDIQLAAGDVLDQSLTWQMPTVGDNQQVDILLFTQNGYENVPYRQLRLWINVTE